MKTSCINHPPDSYFIKIYDWQVELFGGNSTTAALLSFFEHWHNHKLVNRPKAMQFNKISEMHGEEATQDISLYQWHTEAEIEKGIKIAKRTAIAASMKTLVERGFITIHRNPNPKFAFDKTRHFLFHPEKVNEAIAQADDTLSTDPSTGICSRSSDSKSRQADSGSRSSDSKSAIPYIHPESTNIETSKTHTQDARGAKNQESECSQNFSDNFWQDPEPPKTRPTPINQTTVNQIPVTSSAALDQGSAPRERESFSNYSSGLKTGAIATRRLSNWEKPQGEWWGRWRTGQGPSQWNEGFIDWMTTNWIQGKKRDRCAVIGYLVNCEADRTGAALQKLDGFFDSYELSWEAQTGHSADEKWLALASKLYENSKETEHCDAA